MKPRPPLLRCKNVSASPLSRQRSSFNNTIRTPLAFQPGSQCQRRNISSPAALDPNPTVILPDLFVSFLSQKPTPNPNYKKLRGLLEPSMRNIFNYSNREYKKRVRADFPYFGALFAPTAASLEYQTICDYFHWIFDFDDMFDDGRLSKDPEGARRELDRLVAILSSDTAVTKADGLRYVFQTIWKRIVQSSTKGVQERFAKYTRDYCDAIARQITEGQQQQQLNNTSVEDYIKIRSESLGARPFFPLIEYSQFLDLPDEIFNHPAIKEIEAVAVEILVLHNDLLSYQKEYSTSPTSPNIITLYRHHHRHPNAQHQNLPPLTQQQAYNSIDELLRARYKRWYMAHANLPVLGEKVDEQVQKYVGGCADVVRSNLYWSFWTERYFGEEKEEVRRTRRVRALG